MNDYCTNPTLNNTPELTFKTLNEVIKALADVTYTYPLEALPKHKLSWLEKIMNKLGWYRQTTVYVIKHDKIRWFYRDVQPELFR